MLVITCLLIQFYLCAKFIAMKTMSYNEMSNVIGGISSSCIKGIAGEFLAWGALFGVTSVVTAGLAVAGLMVAPIIMVASCING